MDPVDPPPRSTQQESRDISRFKQLAGVVSESPAPPLVVSITDEGFPFAHHESVPEEEPPPSAAELQAGEPEGRVPNPRTSWEDPNELRPGIPGVQGSREPNVELQDKQHAQQWESKARLNQMIKEEFTKLMEAVDPPPPDFPEEPEPEAMPLPLDQSDPGPELEDIPDVPDPENTNEPPDPVPDPEYTNEPPDPVFESQDPFKRIRDLALKPYGSCKSEGEK